MLFVALIAVGGGLIALFLLESRRNLSTVEMERLQSSARIVGINLERQLVAVSNALQSIRKDFGTSLESNRLSEVSHRLNALAQSLPGVRTIQAIDRHGVVLASNRPELVGSDFSEREYFVTARAGRKADTFYVSQPFRTVLAVYSINVTYAVFEPAGEFAGIVTATLDPDFFQVLLQSVLHAPDASAGLAHYDGTLFLNIPVKANILGMNLAQPGSAFTKHRASGFNETTRIDYILAQKETRIYSIREILSSQIDFDKPLNFAISRSLSKVEQDWRTQAIFISVLYFILCGGAAASLYSYQRNREKTEENYAKQRQHQAFLSSITDNLPISIAYFDRDRKYRFANPTTAAWSGRPASELIGKTLNDILGPSFRDDPAIDEVLLGKSSRSDQQIGFPDGVTRWVDITRIPNIDEDGHTQGYLRMMLDISDRRAAELDARERENFVRLIADNLPISIAYIDADGKFRFVNRTSELWNARSRDEMLGQDHNAFVKLGNDDGAERNEIGKVFNGGIVWSEHRLTYPDGITRWVEITRVPDFGADGIVRGYFRMVIDVSDRKAADLHYEHASVRLQATLNATVDGIVTIDQNGKIRSVNGAVTRMFGYTPSELIGENVRILMPEPYHSEHDGYLAEYLRSGVAKIIGKGREIKARHKDGRIFDIDLAVALLPIEADAGSFIGTIRDISDRKAAEEQLRQAQKMEAIGQLTGGIAHDFNNLLSIIMGNLQLLDRRGLNEQTRESLLQPALRATRRGGELTRQLLAFGRRQMLRPVPTQLAELLPGLKNMLTRTLGETIAWDWVLAHDLASCLVDPVQLESAILNLAINARDAMPNGGTIMFEAYNFASDAPGSGDEALKKGKYVVIAVTDTGHGMSPEAKKRAVEPFFTTKEVGKGTGLGLSMVYGFVKQSGGHMTIKSSEGKGTTVALYLPQLEDKMVDAEDPLRRADHPALFSGTVLIVEDQDDVRATAIAQFEYLGFSVLSAKTGREALSIMLSGKHKIDLLFSDVVLGNGMNGPELVEQARRIDPGIKVLYVSGYAESMRGGGKAVERDAHLLNKPYQQDQLVKAVSQILTGKLSTP